MQVNLHLLGVVISHNLLSLIKLFFQNVLRFMFVCCLFICGHCANILYVVPFTSTSHYIMLRPIGLELARRGHNVTVITANKEKSPPKNYHEIMVDDKKIWDVIGK